MYLTEVKLACKLQHVEKSKKKKIIFLLEHGFCTAVCTQISHCNIGFNVLLEKIIAELICVQSSITELNKPMGEQFSLVTSLCICTHLHIGLTLLLYVLAVLIKLQIN